MSVTEQQSTFRPLVAVVCMAREKDAEGKADHVDQAAKRKDYENTLLALNHFIKLDCVYQLKKNDDEKSEDLEHTLMFEKKRLQANVIKEMVPNLKVLWKKDELMSFCAEVVKIIDNKENKHDSLIFVITSHAKKDQRNEKIDENFRKISDSCGTLIDLEKIFEPFTKGKSTTHPREFPKYFFIDRYFESDFDTFDDMGNFNIDYEMIVDPIEMEGKGQVVQFFGHRKPLALEKSNETGGVVSRAISKVFVRQPRQLGIRRFDATVLNYIFKCTEYINTFQIGASPYRKHPEDTDIEFLYNVWDLVYSDFSQKK